MSLQPIKISDEALVDLIVNNGREELLDTIYKRYHEKVYYRCLAMIKNQEVAKDLTQDILLKIFGKLSQFKGNASFNMWVRAIAYNYCIDYIRKRKRLYFESYEEDVINNTIAYDEDGVENKIKEEERFNQLQGLISYLKDKDQVVIRMRYYEGLSIKQISDATGSGVSATKMRLKRAKTRLMQKANDLAMCS